MNNQFIINTYSEISIKNIIKNIIDYVEGPALFPSRNYRIYFSGEEDGINASNFEDKSNHLEIGVISNNKNIALMLLALIRILVDSSKDNLISKVSDLLEDYEGEERTIDDIIKILGANEKHFMDSFALNEKFERILSGAYDRDDYTITKNIMQVDVWTQTRVFEQIRDLL